MKQSSTREPSLLPSVGARETEGLPVKCIVSLETYIFVGLASSCVVGVSSCVVCLSRASSSCVLLCLANRKADNKVEEILLVREIENVLETTRDYFIGSGVYWDPRDTLSFQKPWAQNPHRKNLSESL